MLCKPVQLHLQLSDLCLKVLDGVVVLFLILGCVAVESRKQLLNTLLELLVVPGKALVKTFLELDLGVLARLIFSDALVLLLLLASQLAHKHVP